MRLLVITRAPWLDDNGTGRTLSDFFQTFLIQKFMDYVYVKHLV